MVKPIFTYPLPSAPADELAELGRDPNRGRRPCRSCPDSRGLDELSRGRLSAECRRWRPCAARRSWPRTTATSRADALLFYAGGDGGGDLMANVNHIDGLGKDVIFFVRHKSGPLYYWYEGAMARFLHQHTDELATQAVGYEDVVVDSLDEVRWRLRSLCGLRNTVGSRIIAVGGPAAGLSPQESFPVGSGNAGGWTSRHSRTKSWAS